MVCTMGTSVSANRQHFKPVLGKKNIYYFCNKNYSKQKIYVLQIPTESVKDQNPYVKRNIHSVMICPVLTQ